MRFLLMVIVLLSFPLRAEFKPYERKPSDNYCINCHQLKTTQLSKNSNFTAPPFDVLMRQIRYYYREEEAFINYLLSFLKQPSKDKSVCTPCIKRWGLMPPQRLSDKEIKAIGKWMFQTYR